MLLLPAAAADVDFVRDISPIFARRCLVCHGAKMHQSEFRLDRRADALRGGASGVAAIVPGSSEKSLLIRYISGADPKLVMPPGPTRLPEREQTLLRNWIDAGAVWPDSGDRKHVSSTGPEGSLGFSTAPPCCSACGEKHGVGAQCD